jgi:copper(I)-binding protein
VFKSAFRILVALSLLNSMASAMAEVVVTDAWVRGTVEGQASTGAYMTLSTRQDVTLIGASSDVAGHASIHEMKMHGDMMMMRPVERLAIPAGQPFALDEGHYHVMLDGLKRRLSVGDSVRLDLQFLDAKGGRQVVHVVARVRDLAAHDSRNMHPGMEHE